MVVVVGMEGTVVAVVEVRVVVMEGLVVAEETEAVAEMVVGGVVDVEVNTSIICFPIMKTNSCQDRRLLMSNCWWRADVGYRVLVF